MEDMITIIENRKRFHKDPGVVLTGKLLEGREPWKVPFVHIAGTNGKGSTAAFLASVFKRCGYRAGLFTSPHLIDFTERIRVNGRKITREYACRLAEQIVRLGEGRGIEGGMFDYCTVMAVEYFEEQKCDIAVMETGLGGRLDSTNALGVPELTVITPIGRDHCQFLGNTVSQIASEKAGIIKAGSSVVLAPQEREAGQVLEEACRQAQVPYVSAAEYQTAAEQLELGLAGEYQKINAAVVLAAVDILRRKNWQLPEDAVRQGLAEARWPGRLERVQTEPEIFLDGAHNIHGVKALRKSLERLYPGKKLHLLMGVLADKDYEEMLAEMLPLAARVDTVTPDSGRALQGERLSEMVRSQGLPSCYYAKTEEALAAMQAAPAEEAICIFGSLYFIGEVERLLGRVL